MDYSTQPVVYEQHNAVSNRTYLKKASEAVFIRPIKGRLTLAVRKGYNVLIKHAQECGAEQDDFIINNRAFVNQSEVDSSNYEFLKDLGRRFVGTLVEWDSMSEEGRRRFGIAALLSHWEIIEGEIHFGFDSRIKERLLNPEIYARISLSMQGRFRSSFALALYEIGARYATNPSRVTQRRPWTEWRNMMCGEEAGAYDAFKYFNRLLKRAIDEVNAVSDLDIQCVIFKNGRTVTDLQFKISEKQQKGLEFSDPNILNSDLTKKLIELGLKPQAAIKVMTNNDEANIEAAFNATKKRALKKGAEPLASPAAYFLSLLREGHYEVSQSEALPSPGSRRKENRSSSAREKILQAYKDEQAKEAEELFNELADSEQTKFVEAFKSEIVESNAALAAAFKKGGLKSALVSKSLYRWFGAQTWGEPTDSDLLNFTMQQQSKPAK